ncbi:MAG: hypothetical protein JWQ69_3112 [Pseudomonas sp.]|nr:hypothetical protein [Pseudomonas sp.]
MSVVSTRRYIPSLAGAVMVGALGVADAAQIDAGPDWNIHWDNTVLYNLGFRAKDVDSRIGNNPVYSENDYRFNKAGDVVTNRLSLLTEFDASHVQSFGSAGFRVSGSGFHDFAYDDDVRNNTGDVAPGVPYSALGSYQNNRLSTYTRDHYVGGAEVLDAFVFANLDDVMGHATSVKLGRLTEYWGNALFFGYAGINYSQNAVDNIKGASAPGTQAKELAIPRSQFLVTTQLTQTLSAEAQYFLEFEGNRLPEGGTYLGITGFLFDGPDYLLGPGGVPHGSDYKPAGINSNYGLKLSWSPDWLRGALGVYYRRLDETQPWAPLFGVDGSGVANYHESYAQNVDMFGISLDKQIGTLSTGFEVSYRHNTALNSTTGPLLGDLSGRNGARGDTLNVIANVLSGLTPTPLYDTGTVLGEIAYTRKLSVTENKDLYNGTHSAGCATGSKWDGCSTDDAVAIAGQFDPSWLQVFPGVDLDMPVFAMYGLYGNAASLGAPVNQGALNYTFGVHALVRQEYNITLQYNGYHAHTNGGLTNFPTANGTPVPVGTSGFPSYYASGNGTYFYNDKDWVSLTFQASF